MFCFVCSLCSIWWCAVGWMIIWLWRSWLFILRLLWTRVSVCRELWLWPRSERRRAPSTCRPPRVTVSSWPLTSWPSPPQPGVTAQVPSSGPWTTGVPACWTAWSRAGRREWCLIRRCRRTWRTCGTEACSGIHGRSCFHCHSNTGTLLHSKLLTRDAPILSSCTR